MSLEFIHGVKQTSAGETGIWSVNAFFYDFTFAVQDLILKSGDEQFTTTGDAYVQQSNGTLLDNYTSLRESASDWTLELQTSAGTSKYAVHVDLSGITESSLPQTRILSPSPDALVSTARPSITWSTPPVNASYEQVNVFGNLSNVNHGATLTHGETSYVPPTDLPDNQYLVDVSLYRDLFVPTTVTLVDGVEYGPINVWTTYSFHASEQFLVATPEPSCVAVITLGSLLLTRRTRRPNSF